MHMEALCRLRGHASGSLATGTATRSTRRPIASLRHAGRSVVRLGDGGGAGTRVSEYR